MIRQQRNGMERNSSWFSLKYPEIFLQRLRIKKEKKGHEDTLAGFQAEI
jgi:hypothetical protein